MLASHSRPTFGKQKSKIMEEEVGRVGEKWGEEEGGRRRGKKERDRKVEGGKREEDA